VSTLWGILKHNTNYRHLWLGSNGRYLGSWIYRITLLTYAVQVLPHGIGIAWILLASGLPGVVLSPWVGPWIDYLGARRVLVVINSLLAGLTVVLVFVVGVLHDTPVAIVIISLLGIGGAFTGPARRALTTQIVTKTDLARINGLEVVTDGVILLLGALLGGVLVASQSVAFGFFVTALSFAWYAFWSLFLPRATMIAQGTDGAVPRFSYFRALREALHIVYSNPVVLAVLGLGASWGIIGGSYYVLLSYVGSGALAANSSGIGLFYALDGVGQIVGGLFAGRWLGHRDGLSRWAIIGAYFLQALFLVFFAHSFQLQMAILWLLFMRMASGVVLTLDPLLLQRHVPREYQARIFALHGGFYGILMQASYLMGGWGIAAWGAPALGTVLAGISSVLGLFIIGVAIRQGFLAPSKDP
jgi:MFS family permease